MLPLLACLPAGWWQARHLEGTPPPPLLCQCLVPVLQSRLPIVSSPAPTPAPAPSASPHVWQPVRWCTVSLPGQLCCEWHIVMALLWLMTRQACVSAAFVESCSSRLSSLTSLPNVSPQDHHSGPALCLSSLACAICLMAEADIALVLAILSTSRPPPLPPPWAPTPRMIHGSHAGVQEAGQARHLSGVPRGAQAGRQC